MFYPTIPSDAFASPTATVAEVAVRQARKDIESLRHDVDRLLLLSEALWMLVRGEHGYGDDVLTELIGKIDGRGKKIRPKRVRIALDRIRATVHCAFTVASP